MKVFLPRPGYRGVKQLQTEGRHLNEASFFKASFGTVKDLVKDV